MKPSIFALGLWLAAAAFTALAAVPPPAGNDRATTTELATQLKVGDVVFIHVRALPFDKISEATRSWVNHVGIVVDVAHGEPLIAESTIPLARTTRLSRFVARSAQGRIAVARLEAPLDAAQAAAVVAAAQRRLGTAYDTGFNLHSGGQFCSRFVFEVLGEATGAKVGEVESFKTLFEKNPEAGLGFWRAWFGGNIPWQRETVTPASVYRSDKLRPVFDGTVG